MASIVLEPGVKEMLLADTRDFLKSEKVCCLLLDHPFYSLAPLIFDPSPRFFSLFSYRSTSSAEVDLSAGFFFA